MAGKLPSISVVTVSLNREDFIEQAMRSVLDQEYPSVEYVVIDGGSTDQTVEIIRKYESRLAHWASEPDKGMYDALNKGFAKTTGEVMAWLNSDDMYLASTFQVVGEIFAAHPRVEWITTLYPMVWDSGGRLTNCKRLENFSKGAFFRGESMRGHTLTTTKWIQQESTFWRRSLWDRAGGTLDASLKLAGDYDLWARFHRHANLYAVTAPLGGFRIHGAQFTGKQWDRYIGECQKVLEREGANSARPRGIADLKRRASRFLPRKLRGNLRSPDDVSRFIVHMGAAGGWKLIES